MSWKKKYLEEQIQWFLYLFSELLGALILWLWKPRASYIHMLIETEKNPRDLQ